MQKCKLSKKVKVIFNGIKQATLKSMPKDILNGLIIMLVSIPISMGYAEIAGMSPIYGLYGSVLPVIMYGLLSSSPQYIVGVDAAPAALTGGVVAAMGLQAGSADANEIIPILAFGTGLWLLIFGLLHAGKLVQYVSVPVMGGFISGIAVQIVLMQIPKFVGQKPGEGELPSLTNTIYKAMFHINWMSVLLGVGSLAIILIGKKFMPKVPLAVVVMLLAALLCYFVPINQVFGVKMLSSVSAGLPHFSIPRFGTDNMGIVNAMGHSLTIAVVIMAESLLSCGNFANKNGYKINTNHEIISLSLSNFASSFSGSCSINGSVSRTSMGNQFGIKSQVASVTAGIGMIFVLQYCTGFIGFLPVPVLTAIVVAALLNVVELELAIELFEVNKKEFLIFMGALMGVLCLGTIFGVFIGIILSFLNVVLRESDPPRDFMGVLPGKLKFKSLSENGEAKAIKGVVIYRFRANLFFANINVFQNDIEKSIKEDTKCVIIDATNIVSIDATAAERLDSIYKQLKKKNIAMYITEHEKELNDDFRKLKIGYLIEEGVVRRNTIVALRAFGMKWPYELEGTNGFLPKIKVHQNLMKEYEWAYGDEAEARFEADSKRIVEEIDVDSKPKTISELIDKSGVVQELEVFDKYEIVSHMEEHLKELSNKLKIGIPKLATMFEEHHRAQEQILKEKTPEKLEELKTVRSRKLKRIKENNPDLYIILQQAKKDLDARKARENNVLNSTHNIENTNTNLKVMVNNNQD